LDISPVAFVVTIDPNTSLNWLGAYKKQREGENNKKKYA
jgi:hypothetical protein